MSFRGSRPSPQTLSEDGPTTEPVSELLSKQELFKTSMEKREMQCAPQPQSATRSSKVLGSQWCVIWWPSANEMARAAQDETQSLRRTLIDNRSDGVVLIVPLEYGKWTSTEGHDRSDQAARLCDFPGLDARFYQQLTLHTPGMRARIVTMMQRHFG